MSQQLLDISDAAKTDDQIAGRLVLHNQVGSELAAVVEEVKLWRVVYPHRPQSIVLLGRELEQS